MTRKLRKYLLLLNLTSIFATNIHAYKCKTCANAPDYDVAVAGSLLGIQLHRGESFPVGKVDMLKLYPLTFGEFLLAKGETVKKLALDNKEYGTMSAVFPLYVELLHQYYSMAC